MCRNVRSIDDTKKHTTKSRETIPLSKMFVLKSKMRRKKSKQTFVFRVTHVFIKQIIRPVEVGGGVVVALFSHKPWLWL
jgi:hypothetical protein